MSSAHLIRARPSSAVFAIDTFTPPLQMRAMEAPPPPTEMTPAARWQQRSRDTLCDTEQNELLREAMDRGPDMNDYAKQRRPAAATISTAARERGKSDSSGFERASLSTRAFLCLGTCLEAKKTCLLILAVVLILIVEFAKFFVPAAWMPEFSETAKNAVNFAARFLEANGVHALPGVGGNATADPPVLPEHSNASDADDA